jgi:hypothetical protein
MHLRCGGSNPPTPMMMSVWIVTIIHSFIVNGFPEASTLSWGHWSRG